MWRNDSTGATAAWLMNGVAASSASVIFSNSAWKVTHTGDFDSDGRADLVWRNDSTGATAIWLMHGLQAAEATVILVHPDWSVAMVANLDSFYTDRSDDLVWRNTVTGETVFWYMAGTAARGSSFASTSAHWMMTHLVHLNTGSLYSYMSDPVGVWRNSVTGQTVLAQSPDDFAVVLSYDPSWVVVMPGVR